MKRINPNTMLERARAARVYIDSSRGSPDHVAKLEVAAFLDIFHPDMSEDRQREIVNSMRKE